MARIKPECAVAEALARTIEDNFLNKIHGYRNYHIAPERIEAELQNTLAIDIDIDLSMLLDIQTISKEKGFNKVHLRWENKYAPESRGLSIIVEKI